MTTIDLHMTFLCVSSLPKFSHTANYTTVYVASGCLEMV